jgi:hypothetical protein
MIRLIDLEVYKVSALDDLLSNDQLTIDKLHERLWN